MIAGLARKIAAAVGKLPKVVRLSAAAVVAVAALAVVFGLVMGSRPGFLGQYAGLEKNQTTLEASLHAGLACDDCHLAGGLAYQAALVGDFYRGLVNRPDEPLFVEIATPTREACVECHRHDWSVNSERTLRIPHPAHLRVAQEKRDCIECHKWTAHEEEYIEEHKTMGFSSVCASFDCHVGTKTSDECGSCHHIVQEDAGDWATIHPATVQESGPNACLETCHEADQCRMCHTTGVRPDFPEGGLDTGLRALEREHVKTDWMEQHGTWALADEAKCFECHVSAGECEDCHAERPAFHGLESTWLNRHAEFAEDERRCLACHEKDWCEECHDQFKETG